MRNFKPKQCNGQASSPQKYGMHQRDKYVYPTQMVFSPYPANSKQMTRSLQYLETTLGDKPSLGYETSDNC